MRLLTPLACILIVIVLVLVCAAFAGPGLVPEIFCEQDEQNCTRQWISAFSGWAAACWALAAALLALPPLRMQVQEAKKQSAFLAGDAEPTLDMYPSPDAIDGGLFEFRLTNWNRRSIEVSEISVQVVEPGAIHAGVLTTVVDGIDARVGFIPHADANRVLKLTTPIFIGGWENRATPPSALQMDINVQFGSKIALPATRTVVLMVACDRLDAVERCVRATRRFEITQRQAAA